MRAHSRDPLLLPDHEPGLRTAEQFVSAHHHDIGAIGDRAPGRRLPGQAPRCEVDHEAAAEIVDERNAGFGRDGRQVARGNVPHEPVHREIRPVHFDDRSGRGGQRATIVVEMRAVRRAHLDEPDVSLRHDVGNAERSADLDQLTARDEYITSRRECPDGEEQRRCTVVDHERVGCSRQLREQLTYATMPRAALARRKIELDVRVSARNHSYRIDRGPGQGSAPQVRVQHDPRRIDDPAH
jgi:hypothetical protein